MDIKGFKDTSGAIHKYDYNSLANLPAQGSAGNVDLTGYATEAWVLEEFEKREQPAPEFANNIYECTDPSKMYVLPDGYIYACVSGETTKEITIEEKSGGFWQLVNNAITWTSAGGYNAQRTNLIPVSAGEQFHYTGRSEFEVPGVIWFNSANGLMSWEQCKGTTVFTAPSSAAYAQFYTYIGSTGETPLSVFYSPFANTGLRWLASNDSVAGGVLAGKKYVACGDSFTEGDFTNASADDKAAAWDSELGMYKTYPWWIARRNNMTLVNEAKCGSTMYNNGKSDAFSVSRYKAIPADADYITLCFGLNEVNAALGTLSDTTNETVIGAWNVVLEYLITNMPYAKIGIIIPDAWTSQAMRDALISVAHYWGIAYLDLKGDDKVPLLISSKLGYTVNSRAVSLRQQAFCVNASIGDTHPNLKGHEYRSTIIENFLRSL